MADLPRIAFFIPSLAGGGAERVFVLLSRALQRRGWAVDLLVAQREGPYLADVSPSVRLISFDTAGTLAAIPSLVAYMRAERPSLLCSALPTAHIAAALALCVLRFFPGARTFLPKHVATIHELPTRRRTESRTLRERAATRGAEVAIRRAEAVVAVSKAVAADTRSVTGVPRKRLHVVYNPIEVNRIQRARPPAPHPWLAEDGPPVVLSAGRFVRQKNMEALVRALAATTRPRRLILLGDGPHRSIIDSLVHELGLEARVECPGFVSDAYAYMAHADVFALASRWEAFGNVVVEALAAGTPVVCSDADGGVTEILRDPRRPEPFGEIVPSGDPHALARALERVIEDPPDGRHGQRRARDFSVAAASDRYDRLFRALLSNQGGGVNTCQVSGADRAETTAVRD